MRKITTKLMAVMALFLLSITSVNAELFVLAETNFTNWTTAAPANNLKPTTTFAVPGAVIYSKGAIYNSTQYLSNATPTTEFPNCYRFGTNMTPQFPQITPVVLDNNYMTIVPTGSFVNGGKLTFYASANSDNIPIQVADLTTGALLGEPVTGLNTSISTLVVDLPSDFNGVKTIVIGRKATTFFLFGFKIETNTGGTTSVNTSNSEASKIIFDGKTIKNPTRESLKVYDVTGRLVLSSNEDISMKNRSGIYMVKGTKSVLKIAVIR